jgi:hypothetical protein
MWVTEMKKTEIKKNMKIMLAGWTVELSGFSSQ